ncbi:CidA/LrgA family protein [[Clostridium] innocuum]|uniref:Uncharacterized protein n=1 Tax=Clostridium innocuum TaxID=1522 RepID=A0AB36BCE6_CLOIN|nr:CidA/LrgA family protein [[Clostridium] innocuum]MCR0158501.1 hypothetical protein [[Clostridium] innocuum]MCR0167932.1 hypothetical protein [[Clostridium] innocuum]MCR0189636.1 hypothetical protein [[Clostridium] innocuum]MCR0354810.1 hypothetical protein [[Clostridium] innocuum]MCR0398186.1 hypothetical protein [[Clostridium] innocuum]
MKNKFIVLLISVFLLFFVPPFVSFIVSTPSLFGFILADEKSEWINLYGSIIGGALTLVGVGWTISYTESTRKRDQKNHEKELKEEFDRRNDETKNNLSAQYKPILDITCHPDFIHDNIKFGLSKRNHIYVQNSISLSNDISIKKQDKRINIYLMIQNIGRGEANDLIIESFIMGVDNENWETVTRSYKSLYVSNGIDIIYYRVVSNDEWKKYENKDLNNPLRIIIRIAYKDLVNKQYVLESVVTVKRFIHNVNEKGEVIENVLVLNPYDTLILNEIK